MSGDLHNRSLTNPEEPWTTLKPTTNIEMVQLGKEDATEPSNAPITASKDSKKHPEVVVDDAATVSVPLSSQMDSASADEGDVSPIKYIFASLVALSTGLSNATQSSAVSRFGTTLHSSHLATALSFALCVGLMAIMRLIEGLTRPNDDERDELNYLKELYTKAFLPMKERYMIQQSKNEMADVKTSPIVPSPSAGAQDSNQPALGVDQGEANDLDPENPPIFAVGSPQSDMGPSSGMVSPMASPLHNPHIAEITVPKTNPVYDPSIFTKSQTVGYYNIRVSPDTEPKLSDNAILLTFLRFLHLRSDPDDPFRWWYLIPPVIGYCFVLSMVIITPKLGVGVVFVVLLAGKLSTSLLIDHVGFLGMPTRPFTVFSLIAMILAVGGAVIYVVPGVVDSPPGISPGLIFLLIFICLFIGLIYPFNSVIMNKTKTSYPSPLAASFVTFFGGLIFAIIACIIHGATRPSIIDNLRANVHETTWWMWVGGLCGCYTVFSSMVFVPVLGATYLMCLMIVGELLTSSIYDHYDVWSLGRRDISGYRIAGLVLCFLSVILFGCLRSLNGWLRNKDRRRSSVTPEV